MKKGIYLDNFKNKPQNVIDIEQLSIEDFNQFVNGVLLIGLSQKSRDLGFLGGSGMHLFFGLERASMDIDLLLRLPEKEFFLNKQGVLRLNFLNEERFKKYKEIIDSISEYINEDNYFSRFIKCEIVKWEKNSRKRSLKIIRKSDGLSVIIRIDSTDKSFRDSIKEKQLLIKPLTVFNQQKFIRAAHPYANFYNKIHRLRDFTKKELENKTSYMKDHLIDLYDIYFIENGEFTDNDSEQKEISFKLLKETFSWTTKKGISELKCIDLIRKNLNFLSKSERIFKLFCEKLNEELIDTSPFYKDTVAQKMLYESAIDIVKKEIIQMKNFFAKDKERNKK